MMRAHEKGQPSTLSVSCFGKPARPAMIGQTSSEQGSGGDVRAMQAQESYESSRFVVTMSSIELTV